MCIATTNDHAASPADEQQVRLDRALQEPIVGDNDAGDEAERGTPRFGPAILVGVVTWLVILFLVMT